MEYVVYLTSSYNYSAKKGAFCYVTVLDGSLLSTKTSKQIHNSNSNVMLLDGLIDLLSNVKENLMTEKRDELFIVKCNSSYIINGMTKWGDKWIENNFEGIVSPEKWKIALALKDEIEELRFQWVGNKQKNKSMELSCTLAKSVIA